MLDTHMTWESFLSRLAQVILLTALAMLVLGFTGLDGWHIWAAAAVLVASGVRYLRPIGYRRSPGAQPRRQSQPR